MKQKQQRAKWLMPFKKAKEKKKKTKETKNN